MGASREDNRGRFVYTEVRENVPKVLRDAPIIHLVIELDAACEEDFLSFHAQSPPTSRVGRLLDAKKIELVEDRLAARGRMARYLDSERAESRALTSAKTAPRALASAVRFGQTSASTRISLRGRMRRTARRTVQKKSSGL